ncbi:MAG: hypothetical protein R3242_08065 [Akkermansiaceae bacterium]|nr:hypothetical protein [Akkermansiaceae bacterium]
MFNPKVLSTLAILLLCAAAFVGYKNKEAFEEFIELREQYEANLKFNTERLETAIQNIRETENEIESEQNTTAELEQKIKDQKDVNAELATTLRNKEDELAFFENNPDLINQWRDQVRIAENSMDEIKTLDQEIKKLNGMVAEREDTLAQRTATDEDLVSRHQAIKAHILSRTGGRSVEGLETSIRSVYNSWGFVTLADGDKTGVVRNSTLDVVRDGEIIAKLMVTVVERETASADIVPGSMAPDEALRIGDKVVPAQGGGTLAEEQEAAAALP